eukprot:Pgem_evm1s15514
MQRANKKNTGTKNEYEHKYENENETEKGMKDKPNQCQWFGCNAEFNDSKDLFLHIVNEHIGKGVDSKLSCGWK